MNLLNPIPYTSAIPFNTYTQRLDRNEDQPISVSYDLANPAITKLTGKHFVLNQGTQFNKGDGWAAGVAESPYFRYNDIHTNLPYFWEMDAIHSPVQTGHRKKLLLHRRDGGTYTPTGGLRTLDKLATQQSFLHSLTEHYAGCTSWVPIFNITDREVVSNPDTIPFILTCRPWMQNPLFGPGVNDEGEASNVEWHIEYINGDNPFSITWYFTPRSGYFWLNGSYKFADNWYINARTTADTAQPNSDVGPTNANGDSEVEIQFGSNNTRGRIENHGAINLADETEFVLTSSLSNQPAESPLSSYTQAPTGSHITVIPINL